MHKSLCLILLSASGCLAPREYESRTITLSPQTERLRVEAVAAAARILDASGIEVRVADGGVPVFDRVSVADDGHRLCGGTAVSYYEDGEVFGLEYIEVDVAWDHCTSPQYSLIHEMIHALMNVPGEKYVRNEHAQSGVFSETDGASPLLNEDSLSALCSYAACTKFKPETELR